MKPIKTLPQRHLFVELLEDRIVPSGPSLSNTPGEAVILGSGVPLTDSATLAGGNSPTGSITFTLTAPDHSTVDTETVTVSGEGTFTTPNGFLPSIAGAYEWAATYSGDPSNNGVASGAVESVNPASPSLVTTPNPATVTLNLRTSDGGKLLGNALSYAAGGNTGTTPIALLGADNANDIADVEATLAAYGGFAVTSIDVLGSTPTLATLENYKAVLVWSNDNGHIILNDSIQLGNVLADYVDAGGGVVVAWAAIPSVNSLIGPRGRWFSGGYSPLVEDLFFTPPNATIGTVELPASPVMKGVTRFDTGSGGFSDQAFLTMGATDIADLTSGYSLAAEKKGFAGKSLGLNFYPPSSKVNSSSWPVSLAGNTTLTDSAVLSGGYHETGTITFTLKSPGGSTLDLETVTVTGNGTYTTPTGYTLPTSGAAPGTYQWNTRFGGDSNNNPASDNNDPAEQVTVSSPQPPTFTADTPPAAVVGLPYSYQFVATGTGTKPLTFSATGLPGWARLDPSSGILSGTPNASGTFDFTVTASNGTAPDATVNVSLIARGATPTFTADTPPAATVSVLYQYQFQATVPGNLPLRYSATGLPAWAQLNPSTGVLSGTPPVPGTFDFTVTASTGTGPDATVSVSVVASYIPPTFTADTPPAALVGNPYFYQFAATGIGPQTITFSATGLPPWAQLDPSRGLLRGTPPTPGTFDFTVTASNGAAPDATVNVSIDARYGPPTFTADLPSLATVGSPYSYQFQATEAGPQTITFSATGLPSWAQFNPSTGLLTGTPTVNGGYGFRVTASNGIAPDTTVDVALIVSGGTAAVFNVAVGVTFFVPQRNYSAGTTFNVGAGATLVIGAGTYTGGANFNLGTGAVVDVQIPSFSGTLTGSGGGTVQLDGRLYCGTGGLTLNFPGSLLQWTGGDVDFTNGNLTNLGTITITGPVGIHMDGVFDNFGTIIQTGSGDFSWARDTTFPTTFKNEAGAYYLLEGDGGLIEGAISATGSAPGPALINAGTIRKTAGARTSDLSVQGSISNTGTIEADSGTISLNAQQGISELSGNSLIAGTWSAVNGAALKFPRGTNITNSAANLILSGSGATITGISGLNASNGSFSLSNGATFTTAGSFSNGGSLTLGAGSTLSVSGGFTQTSTGTLIEQVGGSPASGLFGRLAATTSVTLAGTFSLALGNGFTASVGQDFPALTFASATGTFATVNLGSRFSEAINPTSLDLLSTVANPTDLALSNVVAPTAAMAGQQITVTWQVTDSSANNASGNWQDRVYLSPTATITSRSVLLGAAQHSGGLNAGGSYSGTLSAAVPALTPGSYYVLVQVDGLNQVSDPNRANNTLAASTGPLGVTLPVLTLGTPYSDSFTTSDQDRYYRINAAAGSSLLLAVTGSPASEVNAVYVRFDSLPTTYQSDFQTSATAGPDPALAVPALQAGTYYILVHNQSGDPGAFTLTASLPNLTLLQVSPGTAGNVGQATLTVAGLNLKPDTAYTLVGPGGTVLATTTLSTSSALAYVTFDLTGVAAGPYELDARNVDGTATTLPGAVQVTASGGPDLVVTLTGDSPVRVGRMSVFYVEYSNIGTDDAPAPLLTLSGPQKDLMSLDPTQVPSAMNLQLLGISQSGAAGVLRPGAQFRFPVYFRPTDYGDFTFTVHYADASDTADPLTPVFWQGILAGISPSITGAANWPAVYAQLQQEIGTSWGQYIGMLDQKAALLPAGLGDARNPADLVQLAVNQAVAAVSTSLSGVAEATAPGVTLAGNTVKATNVTTGDIFSATILNDGSFVFPTVTPGSYTFSVQDALVHGAPPPVTVNAGQAVAGVRLSLDPEVVLTGRVTAASTGAPVAGASVIVLSPDKTVVIGQTDAAGDYRVTFVPGAYTLMIGGASGLARTYSDVTLPAGPVRLDFALSGESAATGAVSLSDGQTVQNLEVVAVLHGNEPFPFFPGTFTTSTFQLGSLVPGVYDFTISAPGYNSVTMSDIPIGQGQTVDLGTIQLTPPAATESNPLRAAVEMAIAPMVQNFQLGSPPANGPNELKAAAEIVIGQMFQKFGSDAHTIYEEYFDPHIPNPEVTIQDAQDVAAFRDDPQTTIALETTLKVIEEGITNLPEVQAAINDFQNCDSQTYTHTFDVAELLPELGLEGWLNVTKDSPGDATDAWNYKDVKTLPGVIAGGVGEGGPPPSGAVSSLDNRMLSGSVTLEITPDGNATITGNFSVSIHDTFDFFPGGFGNSLGTAAGVLGLHLLELSGMTADVPFNVSFNAKPVQDFFSVDTPVQQNCDQPDHHEDSDHTGETRAPRDPNALLGPAGFGPENFIQPPGTLPLPYTIDFENDGTAAAQDVTVTEQLDANLDWSTFQLSSFGFGKVNILIPAGLTQDQTTVSYQNTDGSSLKVLVTLDFNVQTGLLTVNFDSLDPGTGQAPTGVFDGFLPPDDSGGVGEGFISYTVQARGGLTTGATIREQAAVVFDTNLPLNTAPVLNTIDSGPPASAVQALPPSETTPSFTVTWSGQDDPGGSGISSFALYVSDNGGRFTLWQSFPGTQTSAVYSGQVGHNYAFYSVATDNVGLTQPTPASAQASTTVSPTPTPTPTPSPTPSPTPTPTATVHDIHWARVKLSSRKTVKALVVDYLNPLNAADAGNLAAYHLVQLVKTRKSGTHPGKPVALASALFSVAANSVTLVPRSTLPNQILQLDINAALVLDAQGRPFNGGHDYIATITPGGTVSSQARVSAEGFDALMGAGHLTALRAVARTKPQR
jgi:uncharacterized repeat protein (TIGR01451 family)